MSAGAVLNRMVSGRLMACAAGHTTHLQTFPAPGRYEITAFDDPGWHDRVSVVVR